MTGSHCSIVDAIGGTPLVRLNRAAAGLAPTVYVKAEFLNPSGSVKDRAARWMVEAAERDGRLRSGGTIVEGTSGNTGIGLAQVAAQRGYRVIVVVPDKTSVEKQDNLRAYGAQVVVTTSGLPRDIPITCARWPSASPRRRPAHGSPISTTTRPIRSRTGRAPGPRSGPTPPQGLRISSPASAPQARSPGPAAS